MTTKDMSAENEQALVVTWVEKEIGPIRKIAAARTVAAGLVHRGGA